MRAYITDPVRIGMAALLIANAPIAQSTMYRWVDHSGAVTYSDQPPANPSSVRQLTVVDTPAPITQHEKRSLEIIEAERRRLGENPIGPDPAGGAAMERGYAIEPRQGNGFDTENGTRALGSEPDAAPRLGSRGLQPEAVRDPCLRSADPRCHEKNRAAYVPYLGYAPSAARGARSADALTGAGASGGAGGAGAVSGSVGAAPASPAPRRRFHALPAGQSLRDIIDSR